MNLAALQYIIALDTYRNFVKAAESCGVTQPTLSTMIRNLETELDVTIFDRSTHPIRPTEIGEKIIAQARITVSNAEYIDEIAKTERGIETGLLNIGIIPTVAPNIVPKLIQGFHKRHHGIRLKITEMRTSILLDEILAAEIDIGILATPTERKRLLEIPLYYEKFVAYVSPDESLSHAIHIHAEEISSDKLWVLQEGHCLRNQVFNFCKHREEFTTEYEAGSIDTLVRIVDSNGGYTIIPELHIDLLTEEQKKNIRPIVSRTGKTEPPVREISMVIRDDYVKEQMINILAEEIKDIIPDNMLDPRLKKFAIKI